MRAAIVDDEKKQIDRLSAFITRFHRENGEDVQIDSFSNPMNFIEHYRPVYDIIFLDVDMPLIDGISIGRRLREVDEETLLIYVTKMAQYAINGYEVGALDYILKPISYYDFSMKYKRALKILAAKANDDYCIKHAGGYIKINARIIRYVEVSGHKCLFHTTQGDYECYASLKNVLEKLSHSGFLACNGYCIVNPKYITKIDGLSLWMEDKEISISRPKKKEFMMALNNWVGRYSI